MSWRKGIHRLLGTMFRLSKRNNANPGGKRGNKPRPEEKLSGDVEQDVELIQRAFGNTNELVVRRFQTTVPKPNPAAVVFINGLVATPYISQHIIGPLLTDPDTEEPVAADKLDISSVEDAISALTYGKCILLRQGAQPVAYDMRAWEKRPVPRAEIEPTEVGSMEGFVEDLATNIVLIRRRLRTAKLQTESLRIGKTSHTDVRIVYLGDIARDALVEEVRGRLKEIDIDWPIGTNTLEEMTSDTPWSPFPNAVVTARPDRTVGMLIEGHVAVLIDGSPMVVVVPGTLAALLQAADDYYVNFYVASFTRTIRWIAGFLGLLASAIYVSVISYHQELIPSRLLFTIASGREGVPFPPIVEAFFMELTFEVLREAGLRVPRQIGQAVSIVGVLVIGDAAVRAGLVSPLMIVVVGTTAISTFAIPSTALADSIRLLRFPMIFLAGFLGLLGVFFGILVVMAVLISSRSFGIPFMTPFVPITSRGLRDAMLRMPMWWQRYRPWQIVNPGKHRQQPTGQLPHPEPKEGDTGGD